MGVDQIIKTENEDGSIIVTVTTTEGKVGVDTAPNSCYLDSAIKTATEKALNE